MLKEKELAKAIIELITRAETSLPRDVEEKLTEAHNKERNRLAKSQLGQILKNIAVARKEKVPLCQDTGMLSFYVTFNPGEVDAFQVKKAITQAVKVSTFNLPLRENTVNPLSRKNQGNNLGPGTPLISWENSSRNYLEITVLPKGAGSENMTSFEMLNPLTGPKEIRRLVLQKVAAAGGQPCPPIILGIGLGGTAEQAMKLAKLSLLRPLNKTNKDGGIAQLEQKILKDINKLGIGTMGLGGTQTCLGVNIKTSSTHTASLPLAIAFGCWATRRATLRIYPSGKLTFI